MSRTHKRDKKVEVSFTNWMLGGSLLSVTPVDSDTDRLRRRCSAGSRRVVVNDVDSDEEEVVVVRKKRGRDKDKEKKGNEGEKDNEKEEVCKNKNKHKPANAGGNNNDKEKKCECKHKQKHQNSDNDEESNTETEGKSEKANEKSDGNTNESAGNGNVNGGGKGWTSSQDQKIKDMKTANKSWKEIALEVGASKKDVQNRFKELQKRDEEAGNGGGENNNGEWSGNVSANEGGNDIGAGLAGFGSLFDDFPAPGLDLDQGQGQSNQGNAKKNNGGGGKKHKSKKNNINGGGGGQNADNQDQSPPGGWFSDQQQEPPPRGTGRLRPDDIWSQSDCEVLEMIEGRYRDHKWLYVQAGFYNWTGRMVRGEIIERKFRDDGVGGD